MPEIELRYEPFSQAVIDAYRELLPDHFKSDDANKVAWKLRDHPVARGSAVLAYHANGQVAGLNAFQPARLRNADGETIEGHQSMDTIVSPSARGQGLFTRMIEKYYECGDAQFLYGFPNANSAHGFFGKLGWTNFGQVPMAIRPFRTGFAARRLKMPWLNMPLPKPRKPATASEPIERFGQKHEAAWRAMLARSPGYWGIDRDAEFLNWRYVDHPTETYRRRGFADGSFVATLLTERHDARILYLAEAIGTPNALSDLLMEVCRDAHEAGADLSLAWSFPGGPAGKAYKAAGFYPLPQSVRPIEINFGMRSATDGPVPSTRDEWFVSYSDSDTV